VFRGLGKTLETLATMVGNPPSTENRTAKIKTTLLVLPSSAIRQWMAEIRHHVDERVFPRMLHFKSKKEIPLVTLEDQDIVITSKSYCHGLGENCS
jgi:SNF2 family DNA or RNA helicase